MLIIAETWSRVKGVARLCAEICSRFSIVSVSHLANGDDFEDVIYEVQLKRGFAYNDLLSRLQKSVQPLSVSLLVGEGSVNV